MSEFKVDFRKLKETIDASKSEQNAKDIALGRVSENAAPKGGKKAFISELVASMRHGVKTDAIETIRAVNDTVEARRGLPPAVAKNVYRNQPQQRQEYVPINENVQPQRRTAAEEWGIPGGSGNGRGNGGYAPQGQGYGEREDLFEQNLARQMAEYDQMKMSGNPVAAKMMQQHPQQYSQQPQIVVEQPQIITEDRNLEKLVDGAFKNVLTEIYTKNKIQEALADFLKSDDFVKVVGQAINEISKRNKAKQQAKQ